MRFAVSYNVEYYSEDDMRDLVGTILSIVRNKLLQSVGDTSTKND
jgi:hypothetical protein